jgi:septum formation protein
MAEPETGIAKLVLASASPRRLSLLAQIGIVPDHVLPPDIDESLKRDEVPSAYALRLAREKAEASAQMEGCDPQAFVLAADTVVCVGRRIIPKPENLAGAQRALALLSGRGHRVMTGVALRHPDGQI